MCRCFFEIKKYSGALRAYFFGNGQNTCVSFRNLIGFFKSLGVFENITLPLTLNRKKLVSLSNNPVEIKLLPSSPF